MRAATWAVLLAATLALAQGRPIARGEAYFSFHSNAWLNLHHILWSKGQGAPLPPEMPEPERSAWAAGIEFYAPYSKRDRISSVDSGYRGYKALEMLFHERSHAWGRVLARPIFRGGQRA